MRKAFVKAKEMLKERTLLHFPDKNKIKILRTNASNIGAGAVLSQTNLSDYVHTEKEEVLMYFS